MNRISCVYKIINLITGEFYIGSSINFESRRRGHLRLLKNNIHSSKHLQNSYNKYGLNNFIFHIIEICKPEKTREYEQIYIDSLKPSFNIALEATAPMTGRKHSEETKQKWKGRKAWNKGIKRTEVEKLLMSEVKKLRYSMLTEEEKFKRNKNIREYHKNNPAAFKGRHHTEENKLLFRKRHLGNPIICLETKDIFECQIDAAKKYNIRQGHISENLKGLRQTAGGYRFKYVK